MGNSGKQIPVTLTIAGSDSGGGAGIQADLKTFHAFDCFGTTAITAVTVQNTRGVNGVQGIDPFVVEGQIRAVLEDFPVSAAKTGMLFSTVIVRAVSRTWKETGGKIPLVVDPVMVSTSGHRLLGKEAEAELMTLLSMARLVTPNLPEASVLLGKPVKDRSDMEEAARKIHEKTGTAVYLKGGHVQSDGDMEDILCDEGRIQVIRYPRIATRNTHGTGCTLSAAITAGLAHGKDLKDAVNWAREYVQGAMETAPGFGKGPGPLNHLWKKTNRE